MKAIKCFISSESVVINDVTSSIEPPILIEDFTDWMNLLCSGSEELSDQDLKEMGGKLFQRVFTEAALEQYQSTDPKTVALLVDDELAILPWELLHDGVNWVARTRGVVRVASVEQRAPEIYPKSGALHILAGIAGPLLHDNDDIHIVDVNAHAEVFRKLEEAEFSAEIKLRKHITREMLSWEMSENHHILHFVGHGNVGKLVFEDRHGAAKLADEDWIREQITVGLRGSLRLVVINSCFSADAGDEALGVACTILETGVPAVIAMQGSISENADIALMKNLYGGLARGKAIDEAIMDARRAMATDWQIGAWEWATPVLFINESLLGEEASLNLMDEGMSALLGESKVEIKEPFKAGLDPMMARDERFVGRRRELSSVLKSLDPENRGGVQIVCLHGDAGMGKTAIAIESAYRMAEWFDDIIWLSGRAATPDELREHAKADDPLTRITSEEGFVTKLAHKCGTELTGGEDQIQLRDAVLNGLMDNRRRLLILDSMEQFAGSELIRSLLANLPANCKALITSTQSLEINERQIHIDPMNSRDSKELLLTYSTLKSLEIDSEKFDEIIHFTGGNPMVMRLVVSQVTSGEKTFDDALEDLKNAEGIVFDYIFRQSLTLAGTGGRKIFAAMAIFFPTASRKALQSVCGLSDLEFETSIKRVVGLSLVENYEQGKRFALHQLARVKAQQQLKNDLESEGYRERAAQFFVELVKATAPMTKPEVAVKALGVPSLEGSSAQKLQDAAVEIFVKPAIELLEMELSNCFITLEFLLDSDSLDLAKELFGELGEFLTARGYWDAEMHYLGKMAEELEELGEYHDRALALRDLGLIYNRQGKLSEAIKCYEEALKATQEFQDKSLEAAILSGLGTAFQKQRNWEKAIGNYEESRNIYIELGDEVMMTALSSNMDTVYRYLGRFEEAIQSHKSALSIFRQKNDRLRAAGALVNLSNCLAMLGEYEEALEGLVEAQKIYEDLGYKSEQAGALNSLGTICRNQKDADQAIQHYQGALEIKISVGDIMGQIVILKNMALVHRDQKEWMKAASACLESFQLATRIHSSTIIESLLNILEVTRYMLYGGELAIPAQLAAQLTEHIQNVEPADDEMPAALAISHGVFTIIGFMAMCECNRESNEYREAMELARSLDERTGAALKLVEWLEGGSDNGK